VKNRCVRRNKRSPKTRNQYPGIWKISKKKVNLSEEFDGDRRWQDWGGEEKEGQPVCENRGVGGGSLTRKTLEPGEETNCRILGKVDSNQGGTEEDVQVWKGESRGGTSGATGELYSKGG